MINIVVTGAKGRMGGRIAAMIRDADDLSLAGEVDAGDPLEKVVDRADVVVDFTVAAAAAEHVVIAAGYKKPIVIGTTGLSADQQRAVREAASIIPIVFAPNMSVGVNVMLRLVEIASRALGQAFRIGIEETHHVHKLDRPSGTAKKLMDVALKYTGFSPEKDVCHFEEETRLGPGSADAPVSIRSFRRGEIVGDHTIAFSTPTEILAICHRALTRDIFAQGALTAARWIVGRSAGLYGMDDVLNLK